MVDRKLLNKISSELKEKNLKITTAESCTGGLIASTLTDLSGSSDYFDRGFVTYSNKAKEEMLGVGSETLEKYGAVSSQVAKQMAEGARKKANVDLALSTTGIAGPTGGTPEKPVGLVYIGISNKEKTEVKKFNFKGDRIQNKESTCNAALVLLLDFIK